MKYKIEIQLILIHTQGNSAFYPPGSVNEYKLQLGRQKQVWSIS